MALSFKFDTEPRNQVLFAGNSSVKLVILNRPHKLNCLNLEMVSQILKNLRMYENDSSVKLVILKGNGKGFCAGGDVVSLISCSLIGHWTYPMKFYGKQLILDHLVATYKKPLVCMINGVVMGGGAGLSMNTTFRIVTEKAVFAMPEAHIGYFPDVGASYFLSRLPGYFGEYLGLTGTRLDGIEMAACGLATHFVHSTDSPFKRLEIINKCFSKGTVEDIIHSLENELENRAEEKWITNALSSMCFSCPMSLKIFLKSIRKGRIQNIEECLYRDYNIACHLNRRTVSNDFYEGSRAKLFDKDNKPKWEPSKLELISEEMVDQHFTNITDDTWEPLQLPLRSHSPIITACRL
ncbi:3-hydroxyisobutyryl-CoA hydrolase 1-like isoform X2 [Arachis stenosperma]|uniref:3-hydroxyisobutyryl-CoA hydrolase 1-like isoform X2 n=1 Tax=Arachis stenosperma TaxID=217475 RepID=UPI0025AB70BB|nr:3-hydroxyisobutyryl-CoA hydrolase 1-like isoform X2 [Arachis stenosperma]